jgi:hypothetical protein
MPPVLPYKVAAINGRAIDKGDGAVRYRPFHNIQRCEVGRLGSQESGKQQYEESNYKISHGQPPENIVYLTGPIIQN